MGEERSAIRCERARGLDTGCWVALRPDTPLLVRYELDLFAGYSAEFAPGTSLDVGATYYAYPGNRDWAGPSDYSELSGRLSHDLGPVSAAKPITSPGRFERSEERRVGKECGSTCRSRWSPDHQKQNCTHPRPHHPPLNSNILNHRT